MQKLKILLFCCLVIFCSSFVLKPNGELNWLTLNEITIKLKTQQKPVLIDLYTNWCHWCKVMDKKTYSNLKVKDYLTEKFYIGKVDAETKDNLKWKDKIYEYNSSYKLNDFTLFATYDQASFPTTIIIADKDAQPIPIPGFMEPKEIEPILKYFGDGAYKSQTYPQFQKTFKSSW